MIHTYIHMCVYVCVCIHEDSNIANKPETIGLLYSYSYLTHTHAYSHGYVRVCMHHIKRVCTHIYVRLI
jgi:hypothetical protein